MPNTDIISDVISSDAFTDVVKFQKEIKLLEDKFISAAQAADDFNASVTGSKGIKELQENTKKLNEENTKLLNLEKQIADTAGKKAVAESKLGQLLAEEKVLLQQVNKENSNRAKIRLTEPGSIARFEATVVKLRAAQRNLNLETEEGVKKSDLYRKAIDNLNVKIKANSDASKQQSLNVGNYQGSAKIIVDALEKERKKLDELQKIKVQYAGSQFRPQGGSSSGAGGTTASFGFSQGNRSLDQVNKEIEESTQKFNALKAIVDKPQFLTITAGAGDATKQLAFFRKELINLEVQGKGNTTEANQLRESLAKLIDQISDAKAGVKALSSDTRGFDLFAGSVSFAADVMQTFAGAAVLAGASEEDAAEATKKLVAIQSVANGVKGIANELTTRGTAANKVYAFTQGLVSTAFDKSATASKRFTAALGIIGILVTVIGAIVIAMGQLNKKLSEAEISQQALNDVVKKAATDYGNAKVEVSSMAKEIELARKGVLNKEVVLKKFNETIGETIGQTNDLVVAEKLLKDKGDDYINLMFVKSQAAAAFALANKAAEESVKNETATTDELLSTFDKIKAVFNGLTLKGLFSGPTGLPSLDQISKTAAAADKIAEQNRGDKRVELQSKYNTLLNLGNQKIEESANLSKENNLTSKEELEIAKQKANEAKKKADEAAKASKKAADDRKKITDDVNKFNSKLSGDELKAKQSSDSLKLKQAGDIFKAIADDEKKILGERLLANGFYYGTLEKEILNKQQIEKDALVAGLVAEKEQILNRKLKRELNQSEIAGIYTQVNKQLIGIEQKAQDDIANIHSQGIDNQNKIIENGSAQRIDKLSKNSAAVIKSINKSESEALTALEYQYNNKLISEEDYQAERAKIAAKFEKKRLQSELNTAIALLEIIKATGTDVTEQEAKIAAIRLKVAQNLTTGLEGENKKRGLSSEEAAQKEKELWMQLGVELKDTVFSFIDSGFERQKNALEKEKIIVDERRDTELNRINALNISEADKADKIKILDANVQSQKEAIARRQKQIDIQKAKADKVKALFEIGIATAVAIVKVIPNPILIALVSAIGALQLASVIATPIPQYWTGVKDSGEAGPAIVGDRYGKELVKLKDGSMYETPNEATMVNLPAHSEIVSNKDYRKIINSEYFYSTNKSQKTFNDARFIEWQQKQATIDTQKIVDAITNSPQAIVNIKNGGLDVLKKHGYSFTEYLDKQVRFKN